MLNKLCSGFVEIESLKGRAKIDEESSKAPMRCGEDFRYTYKSYESDRKSER